GPSCCEAQRETKKIAGPRIQYPVKIQPPTLSQKKGKDGAPRLARFCLLRSHAFLVIVRRFHRPLVIQEVVCAQGSGNVLEHAGLLTPVEKVGEVIGGPCICKVECTLSYAEVMLHETENATEVMPSIVDIADRSIGRNHHEWNAKSVLIVTLTL